MNRITAIIKAVHDLEEMVEEAYEQHLDYLLSPHNSDLELYNQGQPEWEQVDTPDLLRLLRALALWREQ